MENNRRKVTMIGLLFGITGIVFGIITALVPFMNIVLINSITNKPVPNQMSLLVIIGITGIITGFYSLKKIYPIM